jgi:plastocyanin
LKSYSSHILAAAMALASLLALCPGDARGATVTVKVGDGGFFFTPSSVTIHAGDTVVWTWSSSGHSSTSGSPGMPTGLWDSGILNMGATFMHTFPTAGSFPYYCTPHGALFGMVGMVTVSSPTPTPTPTPATQLHNISTRGLVQTGNNVLIGGFIIRGSAPKTVIVRAIGPELTAFGVANALADPILQLRGGGGGLLASNNNWQTTIIGGLITSNQVSAIQNSGHAPTQPSESAIIVTLPPGNYTAIVSGVNNTTGVALVEVDDLSPNVTSVLANISTRDFVQTGGDVMIGGFIIQGTQPKTVIVRAIGPELIPFGIPNVLADPTLELRGGGGGLLASNNNWQTTIIAGLITSNQVSAIQNSGHAPTQPSESAIIVTLPPGNYTAIVSGVNNTTGVALVEVDDLQPAF